jgi:murein L,D-transpeptidase YcbB/YkuD
LLGYDKEVQEYILLKTSESLQKVMDNPNIQEKMVDIKIDESKNTNEIKEYINRINLESKKYQESLVAPSIDEILTGKKIVKLNQKGNSVKEIQKMLYDLDYDHLITNFETQKNWNDGIYGNNTKNAVETFQEDNGINIDGIVGKNTLLKIKELYNNKNNVE